MNTNYTLTLKDLAKNIVDLCNLDNYRQCIDDLRSLDSTTFDNRYFFNFIDSEEYKESTEFIRDCVKGIVKYYTRTLGDKQDIDNGLLKEVL